MTTAAGIITYQPDLDRLRRNVESIAPQVDFVVVVDNGSANVGDLRDLLSALKADRHFIANAENLGIAAALNQLMQAASDAGAEWVLTLDQDSEAPPHLVGSLLTHTDKPDVALIGPMVSDRSFGNVYPQATTRATEHVQEVITSGSLTAVEAWKKVGGFDETMFIDGVDTDYCLTLREHGYDVLRDNTVILNHEIGSHAQVKRFCGRTYMVFHHSPMRHFYIARNTMYNARKHRGYLSPAPFRPLLTIMRQALFVVFFEKMKREKLRAILKGTRQGLKAPVNQQAPSKPPRGEAWLSPTSGFHKATSPLGGNEGGLSSPMTISDTVLVIVFYHPSAEDIAHATRLAEHWRGMIVDNSPSPCFEGEQVGLMRYHCFGDNRGIAAAQNHALLHLWPFGRVIFLDQDSRVDADYPRKMVEQYDSLRREHPQLGFLGPTPVNMETGREYGSVIHRKQFLSEGLILRRDVIASGGCVAGEVLREVGLLDQSLFIDQVDNEWCWRAARSGFIHGITPHITLAHHIGQRYISLWAFKDTVSAPFRYFYQYRNLLWMTRRGYVPRQWKVLQLLKAAIRLVYYPFVVRSWKGYKNMWRGILAGLKRQHPDIPKLRVQS